MTVPHVERILAPAVALHALDLSQLGSYGERGVFLLEATGPALVLGSTQPEDHVDHARAQEAGVDVVRRRSGGGAVWVTSQDPIWIDIWISRDDPAWDADVGRAFAPVGAAMSEALHALAPERGAAGPDDLVPHTGAMIRTDASVQVCFAGVGPGEVMWRGRKVVGMSQRRTREGARFQCAIYRHWEPGPLHRLLADPPDLDVLEICGAGLDEIGLGNVDVDDVIDCLIQAF